MNNEQWQPPMASMPHRLNRPMREWGGWGARECGSSRDGWGLHLLLILPLREDGQEGMKMGWERRHSTNERSHSLRHWSSASRGQGRAPTVCGTGPQYPGVGVRARLPQSVAWVLGVQGAGQSSHSLWNESLASRSRDGAPTICSTGPQHSGVRIGLPQSVALVLSIQESGQDSHSLWHWS